MGFFISLPTLQVDTTPPPSKMNIKLLVLFSLIALGAATAAPQEPEAQQILEALQEKPEARIIDQPLNFALTSACPANLKNICFFICTMPQYNKYGHMYACMQHCCTMGPLWMIIFGSFGSS